jgi:hypothetical protein
MSEAAQAFLTGFFKTSAENIQRRKKKAEDYMDDLRENQAAYQAKADLKIKARNNAETLTQKIISKGGTKEMVKAAYAENGLDGLSTLDGVLSKGVASQGIDFVKNNADIFAATTLDPAMTGVTIQDMLDEGFGIGKYTTGDYKRPESNWWDRTTGRTAMDDVRFKLDQEEVYEGMSLFDLKQMASSSAYNKVGGNSYLTYLSPNLFGENDVSSARIDFQSTVNANDAFQLVQGEIETIEEEIITHKKAVERGVDGAQSDLLMAQDKLEKAEKKKLQVLNEQFVPYVQDQAAAYYGETFVKRMGSQYDNIVGVPGWTAATLGGAIEEEPSSNLAPQNSLRPRARPSTESLSDASSPTGIQTNTDQPKAPTVPSVPAPAAEQPVETVKIVNQNNAPIPVQTKDIEGLPFSLEPDAVTFTVDTDSIINHPVTIFEDGDGNMRVFNHKTDETLSVPMSDYVLASPEIQQEIQTNPDAKPILESKAFVEQPINLSDRGTSPRDTAAINITKVNNWKKSMSDVTLAEWKEMSRKERVAAGLPPRPLDMWSVGAGAFKDVVQPDVINPAEEEARVIASDPLDVPNAKPPSTPLQGLGDRPRKPKAGFDDPDVSTSSPVRDKMGFFMKYDDQMLEAMEEFGITKDDPISEVKEALAAWFEENSGNSELVADSTYMDLDNAASIILQALNMMEE